MKEGAASGGLAWAKRRAYYFFRWILPESDFGDFVFAVFCFVARHRRIPKKTPLFNDVLFWIKVNGDLDDPLRAFVSDKEYVKDYVRNVVGNQYNVPTLGVVKSKAALNAYQFPHECCIKPTQASNRVLFRRRGEELDLELLRSWMDVNFYTIVRERNYKFLRPKLIVEPILFGETNLSDFKIFCVDGEARLIQVDVDRRFNHRRLLLRKDWTALDCSLLYPKADFVPERPANLAEMLRVAEMLGKAFPFVRVDLYTNGERCYVGEITSCHGNAGEPFIPREGEKIVSEILFGTRS